MPTSEQQFPESLAWVERGSVLIRRMNSERVAEDPRVRRLLLQLSLPPSPTEVMAMEAIEEEEAQTGEREEKRAARVRTSSLLLDGQESFEAIEAATDGDDVKQESENAAPNTYRVLLWTYRLQASLQSAVQYALFAKTCEDGCFIQIAPRVYCVAPPHITTFSRLFGAYSSARNWNAAVKVLAQLDSRMSKRFEDGACVFDCGLFDGVKRLHHKALAFDEFCDGRIASIPYCRGPIPSMHSGFVITSTVAAWLDLNPSNVAILLAPNNEQMSVFATCCTLYCTDASSFPEKFGNDLLRAYLQHVKYAETWPAKLQRTFSGTDPKNAAYTGGLPRPQARYIVDFGKLLEMRDRKLIDCADSPALEEKKQKLTGIAVTPASRSIYIRQIDLLSSPDCANDAASPTSAAVAPLADTCRPYFVIQSEKGVLFSSLVNGVRDVDLRSGLHTFRVGKQLENCRDLMFKMYHLPFGRQGELLFECRLHASILLELQLVEDEVGLGENDQGVATLHLEKGDFDCISSTFALPKQFVIRVLYAHDSSAFPAMESSLPIRQMDEILSGGDALEASAHTTGESAHSNTFSEQRRRDSRAKAMRYDGPSTVTFLIGKPGIRTPFGDLDLEKIDVIRKTERNRVDIYLLFHVNAACNETKVLPLRHLFRFVLPDAIREQVIMMGASEESLNENAPSPFDMGAERVSFDEEYARWLQHLYETDLSTPGNNYDDEFVRGMLVTEIQPSLDFRIVSIETEANETSSDAQDQHGQALKSRGASSSLLNQLPTYTFSTAKEDDGRGIPDCLICRCGFEVGEEIKSLPCFHSYHSDCIDLWLSLNKVCPVCQFRVDQLS